MADEKIRENRRESSPAKSFLTPFYRTGHSSQFILAVLALIGWFGFTSVERMTRKTMADALQMTLNANARALHDWLKAKKDEVKGWASYRDSRQEILQLLELAKRDGSRETLLGSRELARLRARLGPVRERNGFAGFVIFDKTGLQAGALFDGPVGKRDLVQKSDFVARSLRGETVVSVPFLDDPWTTEGRSPLQNPPLPPLTKGGKGGFAFDKGGMKGFAPKGGEGGFTPSPRREPTMFVSTPVAGDDGQIAGVLAFRVKPEADFSKILTTGRWGETGETYAFDANGLLLTDSRFNRHLQAIGLIPGRPESPAILSVEIRDPGGNMVEGFRPAVPRGWQPLTKMAASAVKGESGLDVDGYRDYRGVPVIGAWRWIPECKFGIAAEIDSDEAFASLRFLRALFLSTFGLLTVATLFFISSKSRQMEAQKALRQNEEKVRSVVTNAMDGIITIHADGTIESFNLAAERLFGYRGEEAIGKNIALLMPEPYRAEHDGHIKNYLRTGQSKVLGLSREVPALRKSGEAFPLEISVSETLLGDRRIFTGIVRDISERRRSEENLKKEATYARLFREIAVAANEAQSIESAIQVALDHICQIIGWPLGHFYLVSADGKRLIPTNLWHVSDPARYDAFIRITNRTKFVSGEGLPGRILAGGKPEWIRDVTQDGNFPRANVPPSVPLEPTPPPADAEAEGLSPLQNPPLPPLSKGGKTGFPPGRRPEATRR